MNFNFSKFSCRQKVNGQKFSSNNMLLDCSKLDCKNYCNNELVG